MFDRKNVTVHLAALCVLCIGFILCSTAFFELHGMKQWPRVLLGIGFVLIAVSFIRQWEIMPLFMSFSYLVGFGVGVVFQSNGVDAGGGATNNLWIIWTVVFVGLSANGFFCEKRIRSIKKKAH